jgi:hypothetical protein
MADPNTEKRVQDLNAGWRNYIRDLLTVDATTFQLAQGTLGLQTSDSSGLFRMADAVPPASAVGYYDADTTKSRSAACNILLGALLSETPATALQDALGNFYAYWCQWKVANPRTTGETNSDWLQRWADTSTVDPGQVTRAKAAFAQLANDALTQAVTNFSLPANQQLFQQGPVSVTLKIYTATSDRARAEINNGASKTVNFSSNRMDTTITSTQLQGTASGFYKIFSGGASGSWDQEDRKFANSELIITGRIGKTATLSCGPAGNWYPSGELGRAFSGKNDNNIWNPQAPGAGSWDAFFGPNGSLARHVSQLILVSDYEITVTCKADYKESDLTKIKAQANFGVWPFFSASASSTHTFDHRLNSDSNLVSTYKLNPGLIQIWGVTVQPQ